MKAVLYLRVSSARQIDNTSLTTQEAACRKWCDDHELEIDRVFTERGESAKSADRTEFLKMFRYLDTVGSRISHVIVWKFDRFSRDVADTAIYSRKLHGLGISLVSVTEPSDSTPMGNAMRGVASVFNQLDNEVRAQRSLISMKEAFKRGRWTHGAPLGYLTNPKAKATPSLLHDPDRAPLVAQLFEMMAEGRTKQTTVAAQATRLGLRTANGKSLPQQTVHRLLRSEIYCGWMVARKWGMRAKGDFEPIISEELFQRVQAVLDGRALTAVPHNRQNADFPLRGSLMCPVCAGAVTGSTSAGKMAARFAKNDPARLRYLYRNYRCYKEAGHFSMRAEKVEEALERLFYRMEPDRERMEVVCAVLRVLWSERSEARNTELETMTKDLRALEAKEARLSDALADGTMSKAAYKRAAAPLSAEIDALRQAIASQRYEEIDADEAISYLQSMFWNLTSLWNANNLEGKSSLLKLLFPLGIKVNSEELEPVSTNSFFTALSDSNVSEDDLASPTGFEPVLSP